MYEYTYLCISHLLFQGFFTNVYFWAIKDQNKYHVRKSSFLVENAGGVVHVETVWVVSTSDCTAWVRKLVKQKIQRR